MTKNEIEQARKEAEKFLKFVERISGIHEVCRMALEVQEQAIVFDETVARLRAEETQLQASCLQWRADVEQAAQAHALALRQQAEDTQTAQQAQRVRLAEEADRLRDEFAERYRQLERDCLVLETLQAEGLAQYTLLEQQIAERQQTLQSVQAQLQAMLVGGAA